MKISFLLLFIILFLQKKDVYASGRLPDKYPTAIVAERNGIQKFYQPGDAVAIYINNTRLKGVITSIKNDSFDFRLFTKPKEKKRIAISSIEGIMKLDRATRIVAGVLTALLIVLAETDHDNTDDVVYGWEILKIILGAGFALLLGIFWLLTFPIQALSKRTVKKGWKFHQGTLKNKILFFKNH